MTNKELAESIGKAKGIFHTNMFSQRVQTGWSVQFSEDSLKEFASKFGSFPDFIELRGVAFKHGTKESQIYNTPYGTPASNFYVRMTEEQLDNFVEELKGGIAVEPEFVVAEEPFIEEVIEVIPEPAIVEDGMIDEESLSPSLKTPKKSYH
jgi:hypothetical protein